MIKKLYATGDGLIVRPIPATEKTDGIYIPTPVGAPRRGIVTHRGPDTKTVQVGDEVLYMGEISFEHEGETLCRVPETCVIVGVSAEEQ